LVIVQEMGPKEERHMNRRLAGSLGIFALVTSTIACQINTTATTVKEATGAGPSSEPSRIATSVPMIAVLESTPTQLPPSPMPAVTENPTRIAPIDGMVQVLVPEGEFIMGSNAWDTVLHAPVWLDSYWIDQTEVTNAMFAQFVSATHYLTDAEKRGTGYVYQISSGDTVKITGASWRHPHGPGSNIDGLEQHPVVQMSWNDASAYCKWAGGRLPTEAEWEKAARGTDGRLYPWGDQAPEGNLANLADKQLDPFYEVDDGFKFTAPVGSYPDGASPSGALDMIGNIMEWVQDWYDGVYPQSEQTETLHNPQGASSGENRVMRGGSWNTTNDSDGEFRLASHRNKNMPKLSADTSGFRCASSK
jgi:formylglycine-generating enzyme required for sulfatase activity